MMAQEPIIDLESFATGFTRPVDIQNAGDNRLFIVEQDGVIKIIENGTTLSTPFLTIDVNSNGNEQGLLGLAFHPNYSSNGFFFVNYIAANGSTQVSRFQVSSDANIADPDSEFDILNVTQPFSNHNGGCLQFGSDGYLYLGLGDGGSANDPGNRAQNPTTLLGKMLRIDIDNTENGNNYAIPDDNPFVSDSGTLDEIWALGVRNPWKFSFDAQTNEMWIGDVGQNEIEEINKANAGVGGQNYGWRCYEGNEDFNLSNCATEDSFTFPLVDYSHNNDGEFKCSITGGYVYRGSTFTTLQGKYVFADFCSNEVAYVNEANEIQYFGPFSGGLSTFGQDVNNELYVAALNTGIIYRVVDENLSVDGFEDINFTMYPNPANVIVTVNFPAFAKAETLNIYDLTGRIVTSQRLTTASTQINIAQLPAGIYLAQLEESGETLKLIVR
ncbi:T9SS C-terminal target domain-containing protein [Dokdonia sinensis]|uniref:T9SS C-terminal target domain-containing protein n=2 Tax=Dokdonia sinensis TaxID=2479847 RepID=A0A3M0G6E5_9FLAO|nr:T9SS C-terminal target domain-containing protein [Dokdonia sinensis]